MAYEYNSSEPAKVRLADLDERKRFLLSESETFCMYPWIHIHAYPTGEAYPCCMSEMDQSVGNCREKTLSEIWHDKPMQDLRHNMLNEIKSDACKRCYEQEASGFFSGRRSANKHHGHNISRIDESDFKMLYWDIRFSNLCNLSCRSCGHIFSSSWFKDQSKLANFQLIENYNNIADPSWPKVEVVDDFKNVSEEIKQECADVHGFQIPSKESLIQMQSTNKALQYAGRFETDMWEQLIDHIDHVEQIYFAGGEPLLMEEHYLILEELVKRGRFDVSLLYNTNFTHVNLKDKTVFEYWKKFNTVAVGASLDGSGEYAEYIRKGTNWNQVEQNRIDMLRICPQVDFYISPTLSIMNAMHLPDFHRDWVEKGLIRHQDLNINILQFPHHYRIDIAPDDYKKELQEKYEKHLEWLRPHDELNRATVGFESAINFMNATDNSGLIKKFWDKTHQLDSIRKENILNVIPELSKLK